eukprot:gene14964-20131_t
MIIPKFKLSQDSTFIIIEIVIPYIKVSSSESVIDHCNYTFYCKPYHLKLTFPYELDEDEEKSRAKYDPNVNNGTLTIHVPKKNQGQHFENLDLTTKLLAPSSTFEFNSKGELNFQNNIEVLSTTLYDNNDEKDENADHTIMVETRKLVLTKHNQYGFNMQYNNVFENLKEEAVEIFDIYDPFSHPMDVRRTMRIVKETAVFDAERYCCDFLEGEIDPLYESTMNYNPFWCDQYNEYKNLSKSLDKNDSFAECEVKERIFNQSGGFSEEENKILTNGGLKNKEYLISSNSVEEKNCLLDLCDILFSYCYEYRFSEGEFSVEATDTITKLSSCLSCLDHFNIQHSDSYEDIIRFCIRRSLIYPYLRMWKMTVKVLSDVAKILTLGKRCILKALLQLKILFDHSDSHYLLNKVFIDDFCVWIQSISENSLLRVCTDYAKAVKSVLKEGKYNIGFNLDKLEEYATTNNGDESLPIDLIDYESLIKSDHSRFEYLIRSTQTISQEQDVSNILLDRQHDNTAKEKPLVQLIPVSSTYLLTNKDNVVDCRQHSDFVLTAESAEEESNEDINLVKFKDISISDSL